jgi:hypothetical protein
VGRAVAGPAGDRARGVIADGNVNWVPPGVVRAVKAAGRRGAIADPDFAGLIVDFLARA